MFELNTYKIFANSLNDDAIVGLGLSVNEINLVLKIKEIYTRFKDNTVLADEVIRHAHYFWLIKVKKGC